VKLSAGSGAPNALPRVDQRQPRCFPKITERCSSCHNPRADMPNTRICLNEHRPNLRDHEQFLYPDVYSTPSSRCLEGKPAMEMRGRLS
jgi:hypothetical protein